MIGIKNIYSFFLENINVLFMLIKLGFFHSESNIELGKNESYIRVIELVMSRP